MRRYPERTRTRQRFVLTGVESSGTTSGENVRISCFVEDESGLLVVWGTQGGDVRHVQALWAHGFPATVECDWIAPDEPLARRFGHRFWIYEADHFEIIS